MQDTVKITCDPYTNKIEYKFLNTENDEWNEVDAGSNLRKDKFTNTSLQKIAYDAVKELKENYNTGTEGLNIVFEGTNEDYEQLKDIINSYFGNDEIELTRGKCYFLSAREAKEKIENIFRRIRKELDSCPNEEVKKLIDKYTETVRPTVPICVMGLYSAGKSAFINALLGMELLPSASDPTTAKTYKISLGNKNEIRFKWLKSDCNWIPISLVFDGKTYCISPSEKIEIVGELAKVKEFHTIEERMYNAIKIINEYDVNKSKDKPKGQEKFYISDLIEITLNKKDSGYGELYSDNYNFVLYDTPGSNSASNKEHTEVLKKAMEDQTNGLPIYITTPDSMDNKDNMKLIEILENLGGALDKDNLMIVVNKADEKSKETLSKKKNNYSTLCISELNPAGTYFVSSPIGIGCKKLLSENTVSESGQTVPNFIDDDYYTVFADKISKFKNKAPEKLFLQLYTYNIVPRKQYDDYSSLSMDEEYFAYRNSGLHAIESAIVDFSDKYSLYNKCKNASDYLSKAIELLNESLNDIEKEKKGLSEELKSKMDDKQKAILDELKKVCKEMESNFMNDYNKGLREYTNKMFKNVDNNIQNELENIRKDGWKRENLLQGEARWVATTRKINELLENYVKRFCENIEKDTKDLLDNCEKRIKEKLISIIVDSKYLTEEQRRILNEKIQNLNFNYGTAASQINWREIYTGFLWSFNKKDAKKKFIDKYNKEIDLISFKIIDQVCKKVDGFITNVEENFIDLVQKYNPDISDLKDKWKKCNDEILNLLKQKDEIQSRKNEATKLIKMTYDNEERSNVKC